MIHLLLTLAALQLSPELLRLAQIKRVMADNLTRLPNYTCLVTSERSRRKGTKGKFEHDDTIRLEVAQVGNKELFAWPGSRQMEDRDIRQIVAGGLVGTGDFALHARSIFQSNAPTFQFIGEETLNGHRAFRYDYRVTLLNSGYTIGLGNLHALVAYHGSFWADAQTNELLRLAVDAGDIPPEIAKTVVTVIDYGKIRIGGSDFLLPQEAVLTFVRTNGAADRNFIHFTNCRQYATESAIQFETAESTIRYAETTLPPDLELYLRLETAIDSHKSATGDLLTARLIKEVRQDGLILAPAGALVHGRILNIQRRKSGPDWFELDLDFFEIVQDQTVARFHGPPHRLVIQGGSFRSSKLNLVIRTTEP